MSLEDRAKKFLDMQSYGNMLPETRRIWTAWLIGFTQQETATVEADNARLQEALAEAIEEIEDWGSYASEYFQEKHDLKGRVNKLRKELKVKPDGR